MQNKDSCSAEPGLCSAIIGYGNSRNEKKIEESKIFYDPKPFSLDQGYMFSLVNNFPEIIMKIVILTFSYVNQQPLLLFPFPFLLIIILIQGLLLLCHHYHFFFVLIILQWLLANVVKL